MGLLPFALANGFIYSWWWASPFNRCDMPALRESTMNSESAVRKVTIFVSPPTDVMVERERAANVIDRLQSRFREHVTLEPVFFEDKENYYTADKSPQQQIPDSGETDLV